DEPELHLHPLLQSGILEYLRAQTRSARVQFILATHSASLMNEATYQELYVLTPPTGDPDYNQLVQIASSEEKLALMRELCGDMQVLTACRNLICIEGEVPS